jgi:hypothetical protein
MAITPTVYILAHYMDSHHHQETVDKMGIIHVTWKCVKTNVIVIVCMPPTQ